MTFEQIIKSVIDNQGLFYSSFSIPEISSK